MLKTRKKRNKRNKRNKTKKWNKNKKRNKNKTKKRNKTYTKEDFNSKDGMLTSVWGPSLWHFLHTVSFNYPINPTNKDKQHYKSFIFSLKHILPCKYCRINLKKNLLKIPINSKVLKNRNNFSHWMFNLHEHINKMLNKKSKIKYCDVRNRYENFRSRCTDKSSKIVQLIKKENGCVEPLYGEKSKCIIKIVPKSNKTPTFQMDKKCYKYR